MQRQKISRKEKVVSNTIVFVSTVGATGAVFIVAKVLAPFIVHFFALDVLLNTTGKMITSFLVVMVMFLAVLRLQDFLQHHLVRCVNQKIAKGN